MTLRRCTALMLFSAMFAAVGCGPPSGQVLSGGAGGIPTIPDLTEKLADVIILSKGQPDKTPGDMGYTYSDFEVVSTNNATLRGWYVPADGEALATVVFHQGNNGNKSNYLAALEVFVPNGYSVVLYDYQGFGNSDGEADFDTLLADALAVHAWVNENVGGSVVSMGASLGGPSAMHAAINADGVDALILDCPLVVAELALYYLDTLAGIQFDDDMKPFAEQVILAQFPAGFDLVSRASEVTVPVFMVQGTADVVTPPNGAQRVYDALNTGYELWMTSSNHGASIKDFPDQYRDKIVGFLNVVLP